MPARHNKILFALFIYCFLLSCSNRGPNRNYSNFEENLLDGEIVLQSLDSLFNELSNIQFNGLSSIQLVAYTNEKIKETVKGISTQNILKEIEAYYPNQKRDFGFALTNDGKLGVFSWNTRMGAAVDDIKNIVLYASKKEVVPLKLKETSVLYSDIRTVKTIKNETVYLFHVKDSMVTGYLHRIDAFTIKKGKMVESYIFPKNQYFITSTYPIENLGLKTQLSLEIAGDESILLKPEKWDSGIVYRPLIFDGEQFNYKVWFTNALLGTSDFNRLPNSTFLKGSLRPLVNIEKDKLNSYVFPDNLKITQQHFKTTTKVSITHRNLKSLEINFKHYSTLVGRYDNYLFFSEIGSKENNLLTIYNINEDKVVLSNNMAKAMIQEDTLIFAVFNKAKGKYPIENTNYNPGLRTFPGYHTFYKLYYVGQNPLLLPINQKRNTL